MDRTVDEQVRWFRDSLRTIAENRHADAERLREQAAQALQQEAQRCRLVGSREEAGAFHTWVGAEGIGFERVHVVGADRYAEHILTLPVPDAKAMLLHLVFWSEHWKDAALVALRRQAMTPVLDRLGQLRALLGETQGKVDEEIGRWRE